MMMMMQGAACEPKNKEQFKLLQYSDDSKSLSDLELTEIVVPRKRKVRRKTKPKNGHRHRKQLSGDGSSSSGPCKNIGVWVAIASNVGWLLIISYIVSMVHSEYASLSKQQMKLAANIKTSHDTSHILEVNQSTFSNELFKLQQTMKNLTEDFQQLRSIVQQQQAQARDVSRVGLLEKSLADFGASLKSFSSEMDVLKSRLGENTQSIDYFRTLIVDKKLNETKPEEPAVNVTETQQIRGDIAELKNWTQAVSRRLDKVNVTLSSNAESEQQKVVELERNQLEKINELNDTVTTAGKDMKREYQGQIKGLSERLERLERGTGIKESPSTTAAATTTTTTTMTEGSNVKAATSSDSNNKRPSEEIHPDGGGGSVPPIM